MTGNLILVNEFFDQIRDEIAYALNPTELRLNRSLQDRLSSEGLELSTSELSEFLVEGSDSHVQPLINFILEAQKAESQALRPHTETTADTPERLEWILKQLGLIDVADQIYSQLPDPEPAVIVDERFKPWYTPEREHSASHYWNDYRRVLERNGWNAESIATVQDQAREVMKRIEDPTADHYVSTRGLVVGYVQSGKTANFTAVAAKAIDAGYRLIIVLAGTLNNLRNQTQRRLDKELFGREAVLAGRIEEEMTERERRAEAYFNGDEEWDRAWHEQGGAFVQHGAPYGQTGFPRITRLTTSAEDYRRPTGANPLEATIPDPTKPVHHPDNLNNMPCMVAVVKKHSGVLEQLNSDLKRANRVNGAISDIPTLIIDDESDQASINTKNNSKKSADEERERTAVNAEITKLLKNCPRAQYVGYTATPFANVFVDPSDPEDLYPRHYVLMLNQPPAYRGARWFHDRTDFQDDPSEATIENSNSKAFIRDIAEESETDPEAFRDVRRDELQQALDMFVLTGAIKKYREANDTSLKFKHHTMLVHEGVGTDAHTDARDILDELWASRRYNLGRPIQELQRLFEHDLLPVMELDRYSDGAPFPSTYAELHPFINIAYEEINKNLPVGKSSPILQVDTEGKDTPDFESGKVWKVLVGGAKLSRGYTVEGLTISYFRRRAGGADTLMQTGRWFGFRKGYQDLVRLYAPPSLVEMFEAAMHDEAVFRDNIRAFKKLDDDDRPELTPMQLAPLVQQSQPDLLPTSKNKMFNAYLVKTAVAPEVVEFLSIPEAKRKQDLAYNFNEVAIPLLQCLEPEPYTFAWLKLEGRRKNNFQQNLGDSMAYVGTMPAAQFVELFDRMKWYEGINYKENIVNPRTKYMRELIGNGRHANPDTSDFSEVAVILPVSKGVIRTGHNPQALKVPGVKFEVPLVARTRRENRHDITGSPPTYRYIVENLAAGNLATNIKPEQAEQFGLKRKAAERYARLAEPTSLVNGRYSSRGAVLLTLFDDRPKQHIRDMKQNSNYTPPNYANGEVGVALSLNTPHGPVKDTHGIFEWGVRIPSRKGVTPITVDAAEIPER